MIDRSLKESNILIIDDIVSNVQILEGFLQLKGYSNVIGISDSRQVVEKLANFEPDLILLDLNMPYYSGYEIIDQIKSILSSNDYIPILVLTADSSEDAKLRALQAGASDFLSKPFNLLEVDLRIRNLLFTAYLYQQTKQQSRTLDQQVYEKTAMLREKMDELRLEKEKVEASLKFRTTFINNISHQLKTPLNSIIGFSEILLSPDIQDDEKSEYLELLKLSGKKLSKIISNFVEVSSLVSSNYFPVQGPFKAEEIIRNLLNSLEYDIHFNKVEIKVEISKEIKGYTLLCDEGIIHKILYQLLDNAIQFGGGNPVIIKVYEQHERLVFAVQDTGIGMEQQTIDTLFNPYVNLSNELGNPVKGTGLGLIIAKGYTEVLQGNIWVKSEKGQGSEFFVSLPLKKEKAQGPTTGSGAAFNVLLVEDEEINFMYMNIILSQEQIKVTHAKTGLEALRFCQGKEDFGAILMDINLPGMDGYESTRQIKQIRKDIPVIAISAEYGDLYTQKAKEAGCSYVLNKPVKADELKSLIKAIREAQ